jgi:hypothetical protein
MSTFVLFCVLQLLDALTTLVFLRFGVAEGNPLVRFALGLSASPVLPIALLKLVGCALAFAAWKRRRTRALRFANVVFGVCVLWNLAAISAPPR